MFFLIRTWHFKYFSVKPDCVSLFIDLPKACFNMFRSNVLDYARVQVSLLQCLASWQILVWVNFTWRYVFTCPECVCYVTRFRKRLRSHFLLLIFFHHTVHQRAGLTSAWTGPGCSRGRTSSHHTFCPTGCRWCRWRCRTAPGQAWRLHTQGERRRGSHSEEQDVWWTQYNTFAAIRDKFPHDTILYRSTGQQFHYSDRRSWHDFDLIQGSVDMRRWILYRTKNNHFFFATTHQHFYSDQTTTKYLLILISQLNNLSRHLTNKTNFFLINIPFDH